MTPEYAAFLAGKAPRAVRTGIEPAPFHEALRPDQRDVTGFCLRQGRAAIFGDTGTGKSLNELEWCEQAAHATNGYALILTPLAVAKQFEREAQKFGYDARVVRSREDVRAGINVCNYDRLDLLNADAFGAVALDESSILKSFNGRTTAKLMAAFKDTPFRLCATATPAPNDHMELGQHSQFLGVMDSNEMLARWFVSDQTEMGRYRLKKHGVTDFWDWVASWARCYETPADLGYDIPGFVLPELKIIRHQAMGDVRPPSGALFLEDLSATNIHDVKRQTAKTRAEKVAELIDAEPDEQWLIFCDTDYEAVELRSVLPGAIEVKGSMPPELKERNIERFLQDRVHMISKPSIMGMGLNLQHVARMAYVGRTFSYESYYQSVRRCWRYGQKRPVYVHIVVAEGEDQIGRVIDRKAESHREMKAAMSAAMRRALAQSREVKIKYNPQHIGRFPKWLKSA